MTRIPQRLQRRVANGLRLDLMQAIDIPRIQPQFQRRIVYSSAHTNQPDRAMPAADDFDNPLEDLLLRAFPKLVEFWGERLLHASALADVFDQPGT